MSFQPDLILATWDEEARVWVAESETIPGLITEAPTRQELIAKLRDILPELLAGNAHREPVGEDIPGMSGHFTK
jgi:predicted RNase H-like HicB family nuclease